MKNEIDWGRTIVAWIQLAIVYAGVQHFTHHNCIAISAIFALLYLKFD